MRLAETRSQTVPETGLTPRAALLLPECSHDGTGFQVTIFLKTFTFCTCVWCPFTCSNSRVDAHTHQRRGPRLIAWHLHLLSVLIEVGALTEAQNAVLASLASPLARGILSSWEGGDDRQPPWSPSMCVALETQPLVLTLAQAL